MDAKVFKNDPKIWVGYDREELTTTWLGLVEYRRSLESNVRKHLVKPMAAAIELDALMEQAEMYSELAKVSRMLTQVSEIISRFDLGETNDEAE